MKKKKKIRFLIKEHILVPKHTKVSAKEKKELLEKYNIHLKELPKINKDDPAIASLKVDSGNIIKIERDSATGGKITFYRGVY